ncbi:FAD-binding protein [Trebonia kvetii]|uniref:FAD-binding protein n=1 Tax=Trebonia kvetii TaxID=2480626 RepID=A0A6P2C0A2_9ACTN|nr:FAD-dependent monooxygenase [Trebonia kvetii]TVZ04802.1 FAD-binding protein [Trebonia kvetii]
MIDVLVVGGGPVGLATAIACARAGLTVTVAEPRGGPIDKACGEGVMPAAVRRLASLGVTPDGHPLRGIRYLDDRHRADALFRHGDGLGVRRTVLHAALASRAAALGIEVLPVRVTSFERHSSHVRAAGVEARYLVAADGLHSTIRRCLDRDGAVEGSVSGPGAGARGVAEPRGGSVRSRGGSVPSRGGAPRYGLRRHYRIAPWTDLVEVHWAAHAEAYVTPVGEDLIGVALLLANDGTNGDGPGAERGDFDSRLSAFPALAERLTGAPTASEVRGAGPMRQDVRRRVHGRVLLVGDASGYLDALTGEGIGVGLAQAEALAVCLAAGRPADYERAWRRVSSPAWRLTAGLLWSRNQALLGTRLVPAAQHIPGLFSILVNHAAQA